MCGATCWAFHDLLCFLLQKKSRQRQSYGGGGGGGGGSGAGGKRGKRNRGGSGWEYGEEDWGNGEYGAQGMEAEEYGGEGWGEYGYGEEGGDVVMRKPRGYRGGQKARKKRMKQADGSWKEVDMEDAEVSWGVGSGCS